MGSKLRWTVAVAGGLFLGLTAFALTGPAGRSLAGPTSTTATTTTILPTATTLPTTTTLTTTTATTPPASTTLVTTTTEPPRGRLVIDAVGDVNTDTDYIPALAETGQGYAWTGLRGLFTRDDLTLANLECAPSKLGQPLDKEFTFRCDVESLPVMKAAGVDVINMANNHSQDYGKQALLDGRANVIDAGLAPVGVGANVEEATTPALFDINGWKVAVLGFGGVVPTTSWIATSDNPGMANGDDGEEMAAAVRAAAGQADLVVVVIHWGVELRTEPTQGDRELAQKMIEAGADMIFGHHSHRLQPLEKVEGVPVAWSLGNFVWPNFSVAGSTTAVARVIVSPDGTTRSCLLPAFISAPGHPELTGDADC